MKYSYIGNYANIITIEIDRRYITISIRDESVILPIRTFIQLLADLLSWFPNFLKEETK